jgi:WD40 repeat protein
MPKFWVAHASQVSCLKLLSVNRLVSGGFDGKLYVWNLIPITPASVSNFSGHSNGTVNCVEKLNNGNVVSGGSDQYLRVWNPSNGSSVASIQAHSSTILSLKTLNNGYIASGSASTDNTIKIWTPGSIMIE